MALVATLIVLRSGHARLFPTHASVSEEDHTTYGIAVQRYLAQPPSSPTSAQVCVDHLLEVSRVGSEVHIATWAWCQVIERTGGQVLSGWSAPVLIKGRMVDGSYAPYIMEMPGDGSEYPVDVRRLFSSAVAAEVLRQPEYGLKAEMDSEIRRVVAAS